MNPNENEETAGNQAVGCGTILKRTLIISALAAVIAIPVYDRIYRVQALSFLFYSDFITAPGLIAGVLVLALLVWQRKQKQWSAALLTFFSAAYLAPIIFQLLGLVIFWVVMMRSGGFGV